MNTYIFIKSMCYSHSYVQRQIYLDRIRKSKEGRGGIWTQHTNERKSKYAYSGSNGDILSPKGLETPLFLLLEFWDVKLTSKNHGLWIL